MNNALYNIKQSSFLTRYFEEAFLTKSPESLSIMLGIDLDIVIILYSIIKTKTLSPDLITISYIHKLYEFGLNFEEIGELKNITKMGARHHLVENLSREEYIKLKFDNKRNRKKVKNNILEIEILNNLTEQNYDIIRTNLGYSESYFKVFIANLRG